MKTESSNEPSHLNRTLTDTEIARQALATLRRNQSFGLSLKRAVHRKLVTLVYSVDDKSIAVVSEAKVRNGLKH